MNASRLLGDGIPVALADGEKVQIRFDFEAMMRVETTFGSTLEFAKQLDARQSGRIFAAVLGGMQAAVRDRKVVAGDLDPAEVITYRDALVAAWLEAMPEPSAPAGKATGRTEGGTGAGSTTSPPSGSAAPKPSGDA